MTVCLHIINMLLNIYLACVIQSCILGGGEKGGVIIDKKIIFHRHLHIGEI